MGQEHSLPEEAPRHRVAVRSFCMDITEVTMAAYRSCQEQGRCSPAHTGFLCTISRPELLDHPINCVDWYQARTYCEQVGGRLPTEREWEYAARGGAEQRLYAWGNEPPDGRCCYSHPGTCKVGSYPPGSFGLRDLTGNVWEWTATAFGPYPSEPTEGPLRVYRGGSFSRRFPKWMRNSLRNRFRPDEWGAHLGFRCVRDLPGATCPAGSSPTPDGTCQPEGVLEPPWMSRAVGATPTKGRPAPKGNEASVLITRDPRFDSDCIRNKPGQPVAYLVKGGSFADRQRSKGACSNRDVGVDFNSICCSH
ncbi:MAG: SUMF1/EgtB/PvdO family nonheme iron enzyme [Myxococcales bacterium]|nr:formylglycine-generating enzyme family protein [Polyangiaceae bacterium]MDW8248055.1 SUMF1/EgtB/PvdO family nonheme iron enzyme [Myxococcales bacterium]